MTNPMLTRSVQSAIATLLVAVLVSLVPELESVNEELLVVIGALGLGLIARFTYSNTDDE